MTEYIKRRNAVMRINLRIRTPEVADVLANVQERERSMLIEHALHIFLTEHKGDHVLNMLTRHNICVPQSTDTVAHAVRQETPIVSEVPIQAEGFDASSCNEFVV